MGDLMSLSVSIKETGANAPKYSFDSDLTGISTMKDLTRFLKSALINTAQTVLNEELARGFDKQHLTIVDNNKRNSNIYTVNPFGSIKYVARSSATEFIMDIYSAIQERTHVKSGLYKSQNLVFYKGNQIASSVDQLESWLANPPEFQMGDKVRFVNATPYAMRLEYLGVTAGRGGFHTSTRKTKKKKNGITVRKPNGAYTLAYLSILKRYRNTSFIKLKYEPGGKIGITSPIQSMGRKSPYRVSFKEGGKYNSGYYLYPTILVYLNTEGIFQ